MSYIPRDELFMDDSDYYRILDNQHLLDATEIFRKLNVHKKVGNVRRRGRLEADIRLGIFHQTWFPFAHVLLLSVQVCFRAQDI